jgi:2'-5' RNA ligase
MALRTFLALDIDDHARKLLDKTCRRLELPPAKINWVAPENLHVTLSFLGDIPDEDIAEVCRLVEGATARSEPFEFQVHGLLAVPPRGGLRMFWAGVEESTGRLEKLHRGLEEALSGLGVREEGRGFRPHITLARIKFAKQEDQLRSAIEHLADTDFGNIHADEVAVYSSVLGPDGPTYTPIAHATLGQ